MLLSPKKMKVLAAQAPRLALEGPVPTAEAIQARRVALQAAGLNRSRLVAELGFAGALSVTLCTLLIGLGFIASGSEDGTALAALAAVALGSMAAAAALIRLVVPCDALRREEAHWAALPRENCGDVLALCCRYPEAEAYRQQVIAANREFTLAEFKLLNTLPELAAKAQLQANCQQLYGVAG